MLNHIPILPTARATWLIALAAPLAIIIAAAAPGAWIIAPAAGAALVVVTVLDALLAGRLDTWKVHAPGDAEVGQAFDLLVEADFAGKADAALPDVALAVDPRLIAGGRVEGKLACEAETASWQARLTVRPQRRGPAAMHTIWLRWSGPLGLGARQKSYSLDVPIRIWPDLSPIRSPALQAFFRDSQIGLISRRIHGEGTQFEALAEYESGMDRRRIDWKASARHTALYARENETERDNQIVFAFDCGQAMCEPVEGLPRLDRMISAALTASYVALKNGDKVSLFGFARKPEVITPFVTGTPSFHRLQKAAAQLDYHSEDPNFTLALATLSGRLHRRSMVILFTDFSDPTGAEMMVESIGRLVKKHVVLFVTVQDSEVSSLTDHTPDTLDNLALAVTANTLSRQRQLVLEKLRHLGVDIIEAPWDQIGYRLIDSYLRVKRGGAIG